MKTILKGLMESEEKDRLDYVRSIKIHLAIMGHSLNGWGKLINNPEAMAEFTEKELEMVEVNLSNLALGFLKEEVETMSEMQERDVLSTTEADELKFIV